MIAVNHLTKLYRNGRGVRDLNFSVTEGEVFGYLGPNGAGKTTTIRNLMGFLRPDSGTCSINGLDCWGESAGIQRAVGYIPGEIAFFDSMTGAAFLDFLGDMRGAKDRRRSATLLEFFQLDPSERIGEMSKGTKQKLAILAACMHDPPILVFDEPSAGLDPLMQDVFVRFILEEKKRGKTVFISSHNFNEINRTCDRAGIIREGFLVDVQDVLALNEKQRRQFIITLSREEDVEKLRNSSLNILKIDGRRMEIAVQGNPDRFIKTISRVSVEDIELQPMALERVFMQYYGPEVR
jgi:ABC-2 type transport system ATP-binding protein